MTSWSGRGALIVFASLLLACGEPGATLTVDLRTDYVAGVEFDRALVRFDGEETERRFTVEDRERVDHRVAQVSATPGVQPLELRLVRGDGSVLAARDVSVRVEPGNTGVTVVISRACGGVVCGFEESCLGGRCVPPGCVRGDESVCPPAACTGPGDCTDPAPACVTPSCEFGVCVYRGECAGDAYCDPASTEGDGCVSLGGVDAGSDAGVDAGTDAGRDVGPPVEIDAGTDTGPPPCDPLVDTDCCRDDARWPFAAAEDAFLERINELRAEGGTCDGAPYMDLPPLGMDRRLQEEARCHSVYVAETEDLSATGPGGRTPGEEAEADGYPGTTRTSVSGGSFTDGRRAAESFMAGSSCDLAVTPVHRSAGIGVVFAPEGRWEAVWTRVFGSR